MVSEYSPPVNTISGKGPLLINHSQPSSDVVMRVTMVVLNMLKTLCRAPDGVKLQ